jgi:hypothetical protein
VTVFINQVLYLQIRAEKFEHTITYREPNAGKIHKKQQLINFTERDEVQIKDLR